MSGHDPTRLDRPLLALLVCQWAIAAALVGGAEPTGQAIFLSLSCAIAAVLAARAMRGAAELPRSLLIVAAFVGLALVQIAPLPRGVVDALSPAADLRAELLGVAPPVQTISLAPDASVGDLRLLIGVVASFLAAFQVARTAAGRRALATALVLTAAIGGAVGLGQHLAGATSILGIIPAGGPARGGTFINANHFAQWMNLLIGACMGVVLSAWPARQRHAAAPSAEAPPGDALLACAGWAILAGGACVFLSLSRAGAAGLLLVALACAAMCAARREPRAILPAAMAILLLAAGAAAALHPMARRFAALAGEGGDNDRLAILRDLAPALPQYAALGAGLGAFEYVFPMLDASDNPGLATHAENEYAQIALEAGLPGLALAAAFVASVAVAARRAVRRGDALAIGMSAGLLSTLVHSAFDFGQHLPANAALTATCCALLLRMGGGTLPPRAARPALGLLLLMTAWAAWSGVDAWLAARAFTRARVVEAELQQRGWRGDDAIYNRLLDHAEAAVARRPRSVEHRFWLNAWRWRTLIRPDEKGVASAPARESLQALLDEVRATMPLAATHAPTWALAARVALALDDPDADAYAERARRLGPNDPAALHVAAVAAADAGRWEQAEALLARSVRLSSGPREEAVAALLEWDRPDVALRVAYGERAMLSVLADRWGGAAGRAEAARVARERGLRLLRDEAALGRLDASGLVQLARQEGSAGRPDAAAQAYRRALQLEFARHDWRLEFARVLLRAGRRDEARSELAVILAARPDDAAARALQAETEAEP